VPVIANVAEREPDWFAGGADLEAGLEAGQDGSGE
jgi:hypothetical protein